MSSTPGVSANQKITLPTAPSADKASGVYGKIEAQAGKVGDLSAEIAAIMKDLQALEPPAHPGEDADDDAIKKYQDALSKFQGKVDSLNKKLAQTQEKLGKAQRVLAKLQNSDLPAAQRDDAQTLKDWAEKSQAALESQAEATAAATRDNQDLTAGKAQNKVRLQVQQLKKEVQLQDGSTTQLKVTQLAVSIGDPAATDTADKTLTAMPKPPATGI